MVFSHVSGKRKKLRSTEQREYEWGIKRIVLIYRGLLKEGILKLVENLANGLEGSFLKAKFNGNDETYLETIDGRVRWMALMAAHFDCWEMMKAAISFFFLIL